MSPLIYKKSPPNSSPKLLVVKWTELFCFSPVNFLRLYKPKKPKSDLKYGKAICASTDAQMEVPAALTWSSFSNGEPEQQ